MTSQIVVIVAVLLVTMFIGTPVAFSLGFTAVVTIAAFMNPMQLAQIASIAFKQCTNINQLVVPCFVLMAELLARGDVASDIYRVLNKRLSRLQGGLAISATVASTVFAALCGSSPATAAAIGRISIKEMVDRGYRGDFAAGTVAAGGTLGIMIPPSIAFVTYGIITETSIVKLLMAGLLPGLMLSAILCLYIIISVRANPALIGHSRTSEKTPDGGETAASGSPGMNGYSAGRGGFIRDLKVMLPSGVLIVAVLGSMYTGIATPTEAAGVGSIGALLLVAAKRRLSSRLFVEVMANTIKTSSMIMFLVLCGLCLSYAISFLGIPQELAAMIIGTGMNKWTILIMLYILWFILGCLMDPGSMIVLTIPFVFPTLTRLGFDPIWLGVVSTLCVEIGMITPPVGLNLFVLRSVSEVPMKDIITGSLPYVLVLLVALVILTLFPQISLLLPSTM